MTFLTFLRIKRNDDLIQRDNRDSMVSCKSEKLFLTADVTRASFALHTNTSGCSKCCNNEKGRGTKVEESQQKLKRGDVFMEAALSADTYTHTSPQ